MILIYYFRSGLCPLYCPDQGDIVGREYIHFYKFLLPYGISLRDSTIDSIYYQLLDIAVVFNYISYPLKHVNLIAPMFLITN
jgi:hypothetical protein